MSQNALLPVSYEESIPTNHVVREVNKAIERIDVTPLLAQDKVWRNIELSSKDDAEGIGVYLFRADLFIMADNQSAEGEHSLNVDQWREPTGLSDTE